MIKVLYVDDHPDTRRVMLTILDASGYEVILADDGQHGFELALETQPDIILMDLRMPRMNGYEAIRRIRKTPAISKTPIIVTSAWANSKNRRLSKAAGADKHLSKPIEVAQLLQIINEYVQQ